MVPLRPVSARVRRGGRLEKVAGWPGGRWAAWQHGQGAPLAVPQLVSVSVSVFVFAPCASPGRACWLWGSSVLPEWGSAAGRRATASAARASRLQRTFADSTACGRQQARIVPPHYRYMTVALPSQARVVPPRADVPAARPGERAGAAVTFYIAVTLPLHCRCIAVTLPLHCRCITVTLPLHYRYTTVT